MNKFHYYSLCAVILIALITLLKRFNTVDGNIKVLHDNQVRMYKVLEGSYVWPLPVPPEVVAEEGGAG